LASTAAAKEGGAQKVDVVNDEGKVVGSAIRFPIDDAEELGYLSQYLEENPV